MPLDLADEISTVVVEAYSYLAIYQQKFIAPGVEVMCQALTTNPETAKEVQDVKITYSARAIRFVKDINVRVWASYLGQTHTDHALVVFRLYTAATRLTRLANACSS